MRRSVFKFLAAASMAAAAATPALAKDVRSTLPPSSTTTNSLTVVSACDLSLPSPDAIACAGYYSGNLLNGSPTDIANQQAAIDSLPGDFQFDGDWNALAGNTILSLTNGNQLNFGETMFGLTIIGAHFGNVAGPAGNVSVFWLFDFGTEGADFVTLDDPTGWSNATLYTTGSPPGVPEPATWAMMLFGFGAAGTALRRSRRRTTALAQIA
jgi:hypothetical protein